MLVTVFTPTYNRGYIIAKLYESLKQQTFKDFEWLIVDDGSTDNTEEIINDFIANDNVFPIRYIKTINGGKHRAVNIGVKKAQGELFFIVDSDDYLPDNALKIIKDVEGTIDNKNKHLFAGICGLRFFTNGQPVGSSFNADYIDATTLDKGKLGIRGDKAEVFYTKVLKKYPFPEFKGEKFCTESIVWDKISHDGLKLRYFNQNIYLCEYLGDGLTKQGYDLYASNPQQWGLSINQDFKFGKISFRGKCIELYKYFVLTRSALSFNKISKYTGFGKADIATSVVYIYIQELFKRLLGKHTIIDSISK